MTFKLPNSDEEMQLITGQIFLGFSVLVAYKIGLLSLLSEKKSSVKALSEKLSLNKRSIQAMLSSAAAMSFVTCDEEFFYQLTDSGRAYFDPHSPTYYGGVLDTLIEQEGIMNFETVKKALLTNKAQLSGGLDLFSDSHGYGNTCNFVKAIHQKALAPAQAWVKKFPMNEHNKFVDLGCGSGVHTIAACQTNSNLKAVACDRKPVLQFTQNYIKTAGLSHRVKTQEVDFWKSNYPQGDVLFFGDIFHDWPKEKCALLADKAYTSLQKGGKILLHEMIFNETKTGPLLSAAYNMKMMLWTEGQQFSFIEFKKILGNVGFKNISCIPTIGNWSLIIGNK